VIRNAFKILVENPEGTTQLRRLRRGWEKNIKVRLKETGCEDGDDDSFG
jgi:hypothetical protein